MGVTTKLSKFKRVAPKIPPICDDWCHPCQQATDPKPMESQAAIIQQFL